MNFYNEMFIVIVALLIVAGICLGLLVALAVFILSRRGNPPPPTNDTSPPTNQSKRIADSTVTMSVGLMAIIFSATLVPIEENPVIATILLVGGLGVIALAWFQFRRI